VHVHKRDLIDKPGRHASVATSLVNQAMPRSYRSVQPCMMVAARVDCSPCCALETEE
jgi:hypothetical protein